MDHPLRLLTFVAFCLFASGDDPSPFVDPRVFYTMEELVCAEGYHVQRHTVVTADGFLLGIYRIPNGKRRPKIRNRARHYQEVHTGYHPDFERCVNESQKENPSGPPVLLGHGLFASSDCWVLQGEKFDLAYLLADEGFDVWFTNIRGNFYSRKHKSLSPSDSRFWDYSFHENGVFDLPATIDYILEERKCENLMYVGHSMGTTMYFVMTSQKPEYNDRVKLFVALTPVGHLKSEHLPANMLGSLHTILALVRALQRRKVYEFLPRNLLLTLLSRGFCSKGSIFQNYCYDIIFAIAGYHSKLFARDNLPLYLSHATSGSSVKTLLHYGQLLNSPTFRSYDHGPNENLNRYGQAEPPTYDLNKIKTPIAFYYSTDDYIAAIKSVKELIKMLPNLIEDHQYSKLSHVDFLWGYTARKAIYPKIIKLLKSFSR